ncbi:glycoside hydrolase family 5 protein [Chitinispirillales bacterium ANBcel5]|uniref:glycoside hydrolase family 5 protein n=1 Tax=Cellulosispirillum alkaliphilum TaxID=3039283 RepID=UPI002A4EFFE2|nr:glycoside hydrolase family 5 protein [Chitinispirillales bacterium ANBcel5]
MGKLLLITFLLTIGFCAVSSADEKAPVERHGFLRVEGNTVVDEHGEPTQLRGMSFFWSQWMEKYYNRHVVDWLVEDWKVTVVRAAMGVKHDETLSGYLYDRSQERLVRRVVDAAIRNGIYVIIDWHSYYAHNYVEEAVEFFESMARRYGDHPNIIYEIYNEPKQVSWDEVVKPYAEQVVSAIRAIDPNNLIIVGTPHWCQRVDEAAMNPLEGENIVYGLHFYAASHKEDLRQRARIALDKGIPLFASEFGTCLYSGDGYLDSLETEAWFDFMDKHNISWCNWSIGDKDETASALVPGARYYGGWSENELTRSGRMIRRKLRYYAGVEEEEEEPQEEKEERRRRIRIRPLR